MKILIAILRNVDFLVILKADLGMYETKTYLKNNLSQFRNVFVIGSKIFQFYFVLRMCFLNGPIR
ncbi:hypothetical protein QMM42_14465 [Leptospira santarosai]|uniref:hypothetical protein n=1 Tax=Leptospira santarosai TaxID=28183 RepID=UPI0002BE8B07|nr:hypothetical protein [Leptospira santarosai]EMM77505.1 hypothetical protein LEP1GSC040_1520 [Leptospira santarosai str. 2000030832]MDI7187394.1 hypothetical protein [Leptospira santarosai]MDI7189622.1 hypothetical protein [Leptospira santarosai]MDI7201413.1 hypothetical protein [Leptospira santarosai]MDI7207075.1 hypothetical protein [Leptospira santarosai]